MAVEAGGDLATLQYDPTAMDDHQGRCVDRLRETACIGQPVRRPAESGRIVGDSPLAIREFNVG